MPLDRRHTLSRARHTMDVSCHAESNVLRRTARSVCLACEGEGACALMCVCAGKRFLHASLPSTTTMTDTSEVDIQFNIVRTRCQGDGLLLVYVGYGPSGDLPF